MNQLATLLAGRKGNVERGSFTGLCGAGYFKYGVGLCMQHIPFGVVIFVLTHIFKTVGVPLYPSEIIIRSFTINAPTCLRLQYDNFPQVAAICK